MMEDRIKNLEYELKAHKYWLWLAMGTLEELKDEFEEDSHWWNEITEMLYIVKDKLITPDDIDGIKLDV